MEHLNYCDFSKLACTSILDYLPESYKDASVSVFRNVKLGGEYDAMTVRRKSVKQAGAVNLNAFYDRYCRGDDFDSLLKQMADIVEQGNLNCDSEWITDYREASRHLIMRVSNAGWNEKALKTVQYRQIGDLALTFHILIDLPDGQKGTAMINHNLLKIYGITEQQLYEDALKSSPLVQPASFGIFSLAPSGRRDAESDRLYVLTNESGCFGASVLFYPGKMKEAAYVLGGDYFILPSSIHEVYLLRDTGQDAAELDAIVREANREAVQKSEQLSDHVYHYDAEKDLFESGSIYEAGKAERHVC